jgi:hypothetical protein
MEFINKDWLNERDLTFTLLINDEEKLCRWKDEEFGATIELKKTLYDPENEEEGYYLSGVGVGVSMDYYVLWRFEKHDWGCRVAFFEASDPDEIERLEAEGLFVEPDEELKLNPKTQNLQPYQKIEVNEVVSYIALQGWLMA